MIEIANTANTISGAKMDILRVVSGTASTSRRNGRERMTVKEAVDLLGYGVAYEIKGAYSGKIYHKSYVNSSKNLDKYANREVTETPFYSDMRLRGADSNKWVMSIIGIWMYDYDLCKDGGLR